MQWDSLEIIRNENLHVGYLSEYTALLATMAHYLVRPVNIRRLLKNCIPLHVDGIHRDQRARYLFVTNIVFHRNVRIRPRDYKIVLDVKSRRQKMYGILVK